MTLRQYLFNNLLYGENSRERNRILHSLPLFDGASLVEMQRTLLLPDFSRVWGIDISHWNGPTDLALAMEMGCSFVIIKAADGSIRTRWFEENKQSAKAAGLPWGAYVWLYPDNKVPVAAQADLWWELFKDDYPPVGVHIDFEWTKYGGVQANPDASDLKKSLDGFEARSGQLAEVYTAAGYANTYLAGFPNPERYKWWIANYGVSTPTMPSLLVQRGVAWKKWQFTSSLDGNLAPSQNKELDGNYYNGDHYQFETEYPGGETPPNGGTMAKYYRWNATAANIRLGPGGSYADKGDLLNGDVIQVDQPKAGNWFSFKIAQHSNGTWVALADGTPLDGNQVDVYWATDSYFVEVSALPNPPAPEPDPEPIPEPVVHVVEVYIDGVLEFRKELT